MWVSFKFGGDTARPRERLHSVHTCELGETVLWEGRGGHTGPTASEGQSGPGMAMMARGAWEGLRWEAGSRGARETGGVKRWAWEM